MRDYLFEIVDEDSEACGEQFFVETNSVAAAWKTVADNFGVDAIRNHKIECLGEYSVVEAEMWGLDTY